MQEEKPHILLVDDTKIDREVLMGLLSKDYAVHVAADGHSALVAVEKHPPDLILLDVLMPGIGGFEVCRLIKSRPNMQEVPILFMTSLSNADDEIRGLNLGAADYFIKPLHPEVVAVRVKKHLESKKQRERLKRLVEKQSIELENSRNRIKVMEDAVDQCYAHLSEKLSDMTGNIMNVLTLSACSNKAAAS